MKKTIQQRLRLIGGGAAILVLGLALASCNPMATGLSPAEYAQLASLSLDLSSRDLEAESAVMELEEAQTEEEQMNSYAYETGMRAPFAEGGDPDHILPNGTEVYVTRVDTGGSIESTREFVTGSEVFRVEVVSREKQPELGDPRWSADRLSTVGSIEQYLGGAAVGESYQSADLEFRWDKSSGVVRLMSISKIGINARGTTISSTLEFDYSTDPPSAEKSEIRIRVIRGEDVVVSELHYRQYEGDMDGDGLDERVTEILRDDGSYVLQWWSASATLIHPVSSIEITGAMAHQAFGSDALLKGEQLHFGAGLERVIQRIRYGSDGSAVLERIFLATYRQNIDGSVTATRAEYDGDGNVINEISAELRNSSDGFIYERGGQRYLITINRSENCILIYSDRGLLLAEVLIDRDGLFIVKEGAQVSEVQL